MLQPTPRRHPCARRSYTLALRQPRHDKLRDYRVLVVDTDPILPTNAVVRAAIG